MSHPDNLALTSGKSSESLIEAVRTSSTVPNTGLCGDCDCATRVSKAGHGNDRVWKAWKAKNPAFHPSHTLWKSLRDYHIPTASTAGIFQGARARETEARPLDSKGVVMEVLGPKCNNAETKTLVSITTRIIVGGAGRAAAISASISSIVSLSVPFVLASCWMDVSHSGEAGTERTLTCSPSEMGRPSRLSDSQLLVG